MSYPGKMLDDGLDGPPAVTIPARQLLGAACVCGGAACPLFASAGEAQGLLDRMRGDPTLSLRLASDADCVPHYTRLGPADRACLDCEGVRNRLRDLGVLQRLGLAPGDTRRARWLAELLFERICTPWGLCAWDTPGWEGCPLARSGAYEQARARGWQALVGERPAAERAEARRQSVERIRTEPVLRLRPHHLMCMSCWVGSTGGKGSRENDTLDEVWRRICRDPGVDVLLVEGCCEACWCCDGFHPPSGRCVHGGGLIRDYKKDLDVFQKLGLMPGARLNAREALRRIYDRIPSTRDVCGYGTGEATSSEWRVCGGPDGHPGYSEARRTVRF